MCMWREVCGLSGYRCMSAWVCVRACACVSVREKGRGVRGSGTGVVLDWQPYLPQVYRAPYIINRWQKWTLHQILWGTKDHSASFCLVRVCMCMTCGCTFVCSRREDWVRIHYQLEVSDLCIWFYATMMDDMVIRALPIGLGLSSLAVKVNGYEAHNRVATWWAHWNTSSVPGRHPSYLMSNWREAAVAGRNPKKTNSIISIGSYLSPTFGWILLDGKQHDLE